MDSIVTKFTKIANFGAFKSFNWQLKDGKKDLEFQPINFIFGHNYAGKTTLSRIMRAFERKVLPAHYDDAQFELEFKGGMTLGQNGLAAAPIGFRVFNCDFVSDNLRFLRDTRDGDNSLRAFAIIGEKNVETEKKIKELGERIGNAKLGERSGLYKSIDEAKEAYDSRKLVYERAKKVHLDAKKSLAKDIKENYLVCGNIRYQITDLPVDLEVVLKRDFVDITNEEDLIKVTKEQERERIASIRIPPCQLSYIVAKAKELLARPIVDTQKVELFLSESFRQWGRTGYHLHKENGTKRCAFCGNTIEDDRWTKLRDQFENEGEALISAINALRRDILREKNIARPADLPSSKLFYAPFVESAESLDVRYRDEVAKYEKSLDLIDKALQERITSIATPISNFRCEDPTNDLLDILEEFSKLCKLHEEYTASLSDEKKAAQESIRRHRVLIGYQNRGIAILESNENEAREAAAKAEDVWNALKDEQRTALEELRTLIASYADEEAAATKINEYLSLLDGCPLRLAPEEIIEEEKKRKVFRVKRGDKIAYNLSEGECNLIAFCYFVATLHLSGNVKPVVWIDDPISSLDANHIYFIYALIRDSILENQLFGQLFISTHSMDFWRLMMKLKLWTDHTKPNTNVPIAQFHVRHSCGVSTIETLPEYLKHYITEFVHLFSVIYDAAFISEADARYLDVIHAFGNSARRFLELYLFYRFPHTTKDGSYAEREKLFEAMGDMVTTFIVERITNEGSHTANSLEEGAHPKYAKEINDVAKKIMFEVNKHDPVQFKSFLDAIGKENPFEN